MSEAASMFLRPHDLQGECVIWPAVRRSGYGVHRWYNRERHRYESMYAHRLAWTVEHGEIPKGIEIHHRCGVPLCCNVEHLEALSRADHAARHADGRTHCRKGHPWVAENIYTFPASGSRMCRICKNDQQRRRRLERMADAATTA